MIQDSFLQEVILARLLMSDEEWVFFEAFILAIRGRGGRPASNHRRVLDGVFRLRARVRNGVICLRNLASGLRFIGSSVAGRWRACGSLSLRV